MRNVIKRLATATALSASATLAMAETQGVTDDEIVIGSVNDLSGIFAAVGVPAVKGANVVFDRVNAEGGVHGRTIRYVVEDNGYQMPRAMQGYNKLLNRDKVFAMLQSLGTPMNLAGVQAAGPQGYSQRCPPVRRTPDAARADRQQVYLILKLFRPEPRRGEISCRTVWLAKCLHHVSTDRLRRRDSGG